MNFQALFSSKDKSKKKKKKCRLLQYLFGALRVMCMGTPLSYSTISS